MPVQASQTGRLCGKLCCSPCAESGLACCPCCCAKLSPSWVAEVTLDPMAEIKRCSSDWQMHWCHPLSCLPCRSLPLMMLADNGHLLQHLCHSSLTAKRVCAWKILPIEVGLYCLQIKQPK